MHCSAHTDKTNTISVENKRANFAAKNAAASGPPAPFQILVAVSVPLTLNDLSLLQSRAPEKKQHNWYKAGCRIQNNNIWLSPNGQPVAPSTLVSHLATITHELEHMNKRGVADQILKHWYAPGIHQAAAKINSNCATCQKFSTQGGEKTTLSAHTWAYEPFQYLQIDFIKLTLSCGFKYCLVIVCVFSGWVKAFPCRRANATTVVKKLATKVVPKFGIPLKINSNKGTHFTAKILQNLCKALHIKQQFHTPYHPQSSGHVKRKNLNIKRKLSKIISNTELKWPQALPLALMHIRNTPNRKHGLTPHEILFGRPILLGFEPPGKINPSHLSECYDELLQYCIHLSKIAFSLSSQVAEALPVPTDVPCHDVQPGNWVLIKEFRKKNCLSPR
uniref:Integrase catalytic domain-containing protein n=1 Tax=Pelodiscus sinensis TaxID=13735 RepID=K7F0T3_PELSI